MGPLFQLPGPEGRRHQELAGPAGRSARPTTATSPTAPNNEFGFDYLRDNLAFRLEDRVQRQLAYAIVGRGGLDPDRRSAHAADHQRPGRGEHRALSEDQPARAAPDAAEGRERPRRLLASTRSRSRFTSPKKVTSTSKRSWPKPACCARARASTTPSNIRLMHHLNAALRAHAIFKRDVEYIVRNGEVIIVDEFTGRTMQGRRWSDGLHQADRSEGRRARARREPDGRVDHVPELLPPLQEAVRHDRHGRYRSAGIPADLRPRSGRHSDHIGRWPARTRPTSSISTRSDKFEAIIEDLQDCVTREQPVLVGTTSIETSEYLARPAEEAGHSCTRC